MSDDWRPCQGFLCESDDAHLDHHTGLWLCDHCWDDEELVADQARPGVPLEVLEEEYFA